MYVTFEELILFATLICGIISLVVDINDRRKK